MFYVYIGFFAFGVFYCAASLLFGGHGAEHAGMGHGGAEGHSGADSSDNPSPFNPLVIASAVTTFGASGLIGKLGFKMSDMGSLIISLCLAGIVGAAIFFGIVKFMYGSQSNSMYAQEDLVGVEAEVTTPIPENGIGEIACIISGMRYTSAARAVYNEALFRGETVKVTGVNGNVAFVVRKITIDDLI